MLIKDPKLVEVIKRCSEALADVVREMDEGGLKGAKWRKVKKDLSDASDELRFSVEATMCRPSMKKSSDLYWTTADEPGIACNCPNCCGNVGRYVHFGGFQP